jgi:hypothetical protein
MPVHSGPRSMHRLLPDFITLVEPKPFPSNRRSGDTAQSEVPRIGALGSGRNPMVRVDWR